MRQIRGRTACVQELAEGGHVSEFAGGIVLSRQTKLREISRGGPGGLGCALLFGLIRFPTPRVDFLLVLMVLLKLLFRVFLRVTSRVERRQPLLVAVGLRLREEVGQTGLQRLQRTQTFERDRHHRSRHLTLWGDFRV